MYRMALDQIPHSGEHLRFKIMRNIGNAFVRMGNYQDAIMSYEASMEGKPDFQSGFNLIVCYFALGDREKMKRSFAKLLDIKDSNFGEENDDDEANEDEDEDEAVMEEDELKKAHKEYRSKAKHLVLQAAKLIAPKIEKDFVAGFDYIIEMLQKSHNYMDVASDMQISKAIYFLKQKNSKDAKDSLIAFEKQDNNEIDATTMSRAYTNLCFIYFLEGNIKEADKYGTKAIQSDRYNAKALVNKGNCEMNKAYAYEEKEKYDEAREHFTMAKELYMEGIGVEADCIEAIFNLGLCCKSMAHLEHMLQNDLDYQKNIRAALQAFEKLYSIMPDSPECNYNIAVIYDELQKTKKASVAYQRLIALVRPLVLSRPLFLPYPCPSFSSPLPPASSPIFPLQRLTLPPAGQDGCWRACSLRQSAGERGRRGGGVREPSRVVQVLPRRHGGHLLARRLLCQVGDVREGHGVLPEGRADSAQGGQVAAHGGLLLPAHRLLPAGAEDIRGD
mmetsp:Transcript_24445/g.79885  ORF Transcript_24445/g.79885 Transcript_24445/m.79885 type:complete len:502 (-) Transcript_24445:2789-4294(-)